MRSPRLPLTLGRMATHRLVLAAAAVSTLITVALVAALFGLALPIAGLVVLGTGPLVPGSGQHDAISPAH